MTPVWIPDTFAALMLSVAALSAARLGAAEPRTRGPAVTGTDLAHLFMGIAMAGMLAPGLATLPGGAWEVVFSLLTAWFACLVMRDARANGARALAAGHCAPHLIHSAAMLYMFAALVRPVAGGAGTGAMGEPPGTAMQALAHPSLAFAFALILAGYTVWDLDQLSSGRYRPARQDVVPARAAVGAIPALACSMAAPEVVSGARDMPESGTGGAGSGARPSRGQATAASGRDRTALGLLLSPATTVGCRIVLGVAMTYMLLIMI